MIELIAISFAISIALSVSATVLAQRESRAALPSPDKAGGGR